LRHARLPATAACHVANRRALRRIGRIEDEDRKLLWSARRCRADRERLRRCGALGRLPGVAPRAGVQGRRRAAAPTASAMRFKPKPVWQFAHQAPTAASGRAVSYSVGLVWVGSVSGLRMPSFSRDPLPVHAGHLRTTAVANADLLDCFSEGQVPR
jgi:hypothetical protein